MPIRSRTRRRLLAAFLCAIPLLLAPAGAEGARKKKVYRIAGESRNEEGDRVPKEVLTYGASGIQVAIRYLDGAARISALSSVLGREYDLFPERSEGERGHLVFVLEIRNGSEEDLHFEPGQSRLFTERLDAEFPFDYTRLYQRVSHLPGEPISLGDLEKAVFGRATMIRPGGSVRKLLVFRGPAEDKYKKIEVRIGALHLAEQDLDPAFRFRKFEVKPE